MAFKVRVPADHADFSGSLTAFSQATKDFSLEEMIKLIDSLGSNILCSSSRETIMYQSTVFPENLPLAMRLISSTVRNSLIEDEELDVQKEAAAYEIREIWAKPELILPELVHHVAYKDNTLGMPLLCPEERLPFIDRETLRGFMRDWYRPERMVVAGVGMEHEELVKLAEEHFGSLGSTPLYPPEARRARVEMVEDEGVEALAKSASSRSSSPNQPHPLLPTPPPTPPSSSSIPFSKSFATTIDSASAELGQSEPSVEELASARARYTGGEMFISKPDQDFTHVYIAFEGLGIHDPDIVSLAFRGGFCLCN
jgi:processing peptidase subunit alpha